MDNTVNVTSSQSGKGTSGFAVGFGVTYQKDMAFNEYAREVYEEGARALFKEQRATAETYLNTRTGGLQRHLASEPFSISISGGSATLQLMYQLKVRFLDLKKTRKGKLKKVYEPIYNRLVWGFVFGRIYKQLRYGFTQDVRNRYVEKLREIYKQPV